MKAHNLSGYRPCIVDRALFPRHIGIPHIPHVWGNLWLGKQGLGKRRRESGKEERHDIRYRQPMKRWVTLLNHTRIKLIGFATEPKAPVYVSNGYGVWEMSVRSVLFVTSAKTSLV